MDFWPIQPSKPKITKCSKVILDADTGGDDFHALLLLSYL